MAAAQSLHTAALLRCEKPGLVPVAAVNVNGRSSSFLNGNALSGTRMVLKKQSSSLRSHAVSASRIVAAADVEQLRGAREAVREIIQSKYCSPILIRLGWHDAGTYRKDITTWPEAGGATASIRFKPELDHAANAGLAGAIALLEPVKKQFPNVSYADLFQLASAEAVELAGGPRIPMRYGRVDAASPKDCSEEGYLPDAGPPDPATHLRQVFYRMGFNDQEIVALSGAHTLGRSRPDRSGWGKAETKYTKNGPGTPGGQSWTVQWLNFDNSYFKDIKAKTDEDLLVLPTDAALFEDPGFSKYAEKYAVDQPAFFADYAAAHKRLSELGAKFDPAGGVDIDAVEKKELSEAMKKKIRDEYLGFGGSPDQAMKGNPFLNIMIGISVLALLAKLTGAL